MPSKKLVVIGDGEEYEEIKKIANKNISILGYQNDDVLVSSMQNAKAFIYAGIEDFGIVIIEAMACGTPVIALNDGGTGESVEEGVNGVHFEQQTKKDISQAIVKFEALEFDFKAIRNTALEFTKFKVDFKRFITDKQNIKML